MKELQRFVSSLGMWTAAGEATLRLADLSVRPWRAPCALRTVCGAHFLSLLEFEKSGLHDRRSMGRLQHRTPINKILNGANTASLEAQVERVNHACILKVRLNSESHLISDSHLNSDSVLNHT